MLEASARQGIDAVRCYPQTYRIVASFISVAQPPRGSALRYGEPGRGWSGGHGVGDDSACDHRRRCRLAL